MASHDQKSVLDQISELAPALDSDPVYERHSGFENLVGKDNPFTPAEQGSGNWATGRSGFDRPGFGGPSFLDPVSNLLRDHASIMMSSVGISGGVLDSASSDLGLASDFGGGGGGGSGKPPKGGSGGGGAFGGGSAVSSGGDVA
jgi:hypothetical protein